LNVNIKTSETGEWQTIWNAEDDGLEWSWRNVNIDLDDYSGQNIQLSWQYIGFDGDDILLDDIMLAVNGGVSVEPQNDDVYHPESVQLLNNYPNPFNPSTQINYQLVKDGFIKLSVLNVFGETVCKLLNNEKKSAGHHSIIFDAQELATGQYFILLQSGTVKDVKKILLLK